MWPSRWPKSILLLLGGMNLLGRPLPHLRHPGHRRLFHQERLHRLLSERLYRCGGDHLHAPGGHQLRPALPGLPGQAPGPVAGSGVPLFHGFLAAPHPHHHPHTASGKPTTPFGNPCNMPPSPCASITTTTGFATGNFELWPTLPLCLLLLCMVVTSMFLFAAANAPTAISIPPPRWA